MVRGERKSKEGGRKGREEKAGKKERENGSWGGELVKEIQGGGKYKQMRKETGRDLGEVRKEGEKRGRKEA